MKKQFYPLVFMMFTMLIVFGCNRGEPATGDIEEEAATDDRGNAEEENEGFDPDEEITLTFMAPWSEEQVAERMKVEFEKEYPNITIEPIVGWTDRATLEETFAQGKIPDVVLVLGDFRELNSMEMVTPLDDFVDQANMELGQFREGAIEAIRSRDPEGQNRLLGLPIEDVVFGLFYNKDIFDSFGVNYPTDGITWDEIVELVPKVTGERNGVNYVGLDTHSWSQAFQQLSVTGTDPETGEVRFSNQPEFAQYFDLIDALISIPGNTITDQEATNFKAGNVAMNILTVSNIPDLSAHEELNFDVVRFPGWPDAPDVIPNNLPLTLGISQHTEHSEAAFKLLEL